MTLAEVSVKAKALFREPVKEKGLAAREKNYARWVEHPSSNIVHHDANCCAEARLWFLAYARSMEASPSPHIQLKPPNWLQQRFQWGPSAWPISWCQLLEEKTIDCGVFAALAREIFQAQGFTVHPAQVMVSYNEDCTDHWKDLWEAGMRRYEKRRDGDTFPWVGDRVVYHEVCVLELPGREARIYDSTFGNWLVPEKRTGFGALLSVRAECPRLLQWGDKVLSFGEWVDV